MKFKHLNIHNLAWLIPPWAANYFELAKTIDPLLEDYRAKNGPGSLPFDQKLNFWIEVTPDGPDKHKVALCAPDKSDYSGQLNIDCESPAGGTCQVMLPLNAMLRGEMKLNGTHCVYVHAIGRDQASMRPYVGITKRRWFDRLSEHISAARSGSPYLFHRALRSGESEHKCHRVLFSPVSEDNALKFEEDLVAGISLYPLGLNMIPGGRAGFAYLAKLGFDARGSAERDRIVERLAAQPSLAGKPNPLCAARWATDQQFVNNIICGHSGRLTVDQVVDVRRLSGMGLSVPDIARTTGLSREDKIKNILREKYYSRVH